MQGVKQKYLKCVCAPLSLIMSWTNRRLAAETARQMRGGGRSVSPAEVPHNQLKVSYV